MKKHLFVFFVIILSLASKGQRGSSAVDFTFAAEITIDAVVHISAEMEQKSSLWDSFFADPFFNFFSQPQTRVYRTFGSGVIVEKDGYIVTNHHVIEGATKINVTLNDKRVFLAEVIGIDERNDLALLKIKANNLSAVQYGNSDKVRIGEWVLAVGNPYNLTSTVTAGIVSAKARNLNILGGNKSTSFIQTDAAVNSGNSGGALVNLQGELIGINAAIASNTGSFAGYSFAIPVNVVKKVVNDLKNYGKVQRVFLGASFSEIDGKKADEMHLDLPKGLQIFQVQPNRAAAEAGIKKDDVLLSINGQSINSYSELKEILDQHIPGDTVLCHLSRNGKAYETKVILKNINGNTNIIRKTDKVALYRLGIEVEPIHEQAKMRYRVNNGLRVVKVKDGLLKKVGVQENFVITSIDKKQVAKEEDIETILGDKSGNVLIEGFYPNGYMYYYNVVM